MDELDRAQRDSESYLAACVSRAKGRPAAGAGSERCEECGREIPDGRREAMPGCTLCVNCQTKFEAAERKI
jgi:phage/conjugal plasmid C-4 type zinc finger TraR family protein